MIEIPGLTRPRQLLPVGQLAKGTDKIGEMTELLAVDQVKIKILRTEQQLIGKVVLNQASA